MDPTILNISDVELMTAKFLQEEPILIVSFTAQQINCVRDRTGQVIEGKPDDIRCVIQPPNPPAIQKEEKKLCAEENVEKPKEHGPMLLRAG